VPNSATLITPSGNTVRITRGEAKRRLRHGEAERISERPLTIKSLKTPNFDEELRYLSGRRVEGVHQKGMNNETTVSNSSHRCRPPRCALYPPKDEREFRKEKRNHFNRLEDKRWEAVGE
jgi:hypothetical protein